MTPEDVSISEIFFLIEKIVYTPPPQKKKINK